MTVKTTALTTLRVAAAQPGTFDAAGYNALGTTLVGEVTNLGDFGREFNLVTHNPINSRGTQKLKGSFNEGSMTVELGLDTDDAGQILMKAAAGSDNDYSFLVTTQNGDKYYFQAKVMSFKVRPGDVNSVLSATAQLEITTTSAGVGIVEVLA
jgi:hypothetical protein